MPPIGEPKKLAKPVREGYRNCTAAWLEQSASAVLVDLGCCIPADTPAETKLRLALSERNSLGPNDANRLIPLILP